MLYRPNGRAHAKAMASPRQSRSLRGEARTSTRSTKASSTEKYFDRNASPRNIPASTCQRTSLEDLASHHDRPARKLKNTKGVSVVMKMFHTLTGTRRNAIAA